MITTRLNVVEASICHTWAAERTNWCRAHNVIDETGCDDRYKLDYQGCAGELVVARLLNVWPDFTPGFGANRGIDLKWRQYSIDVKFGSGTDLLIAKTGDDKVCDLFVLVTGDPYGDINVVGYMPYRRAKQDHYWFTGCPRPCHLVPVQDLYPIKYMLGFPDGRQTEQTAGRAH